MLANRLAREAVTAQVPFNLSPNEFSVAKSGVEKTSVEHSTLVQKEGSSDTAIEKAKKTYVKVNVGESFAVVNAFAER